MIFNVQIKTSVTVEADTKEEAASIAIGWAREDLADSNARVTVHEFIEPGGLAEAKIGPAVINEAIDNLEG